MPRQNRLPPNDDGRSYADMNIEGMPWFSEKAKEEKPSEKVKLSRSEARSAALGAVTAALLITLIFAGVFAAFILFCDNIWFK